MPSCACLRHTPYTTHSSSPQGRNNFLRGPSFLPGGPAAEEKVAVGQLLRTIGCKRGDAERDITRSRANASVRRTRLLAGRLIGWQRQLCRERWMRKGTQMHKVALSVVSKVCLMIRSGACGREVGCMRAIARLCLCRFSQLCILHIAALPRRPANKVYRGFVVLETSA
ncbi:hypothetical protein BDU57DRAFT_288794 [Ampelomyces quisqualis]|uniref:Uncharacterized protein n=1 Tax=Ampelomyces quisqualis TaxID=50730 RepID=A0A6A5QFF3_AMPQU|nr:hypothetical protein BDU57DRAFT_288794 [Ampelomyces quisqualis]